MLHRSMFPNCKSILGALFTLMFISELGFTSANDVDPLTAHEKARIRAIIGLAIAGSAPVTPALRSELWGILEKRGEDTDEKIAILKLKMTAIVTDYMPLYWQDAELALNVGKAIKSKERTLVESKLLEAGVLKPEVIARNDADIFKIAAKEAIVRNGKKVYFDKVTIEAAKQTTGGAKSRIDSLFSRPTK